MGELDGKIDRTLQQAVNKLSKELREAPNVGAITDAEIKAKVQDTEDGRAKTANVDKKTEKEIRRMME